MFDHRRAGGRIPLVLAGAVTAALVAACNPVGQAGTGSSAPAAATTSVPTSATTTSTTPTPTAPASTPTATGTVRTVHGTIVLRPTAQPGPGGWIVYAFSGPRRLVRWSVANPFTVSLDTRTLPNGTYTLTEVVLGGATTPTHATRVRVANPGTATPGPTTAPSAGPTGAPTTPATAPAPSQPAASQPAASPPATAPATAGSYADQVVALTNAQRAQAGCAPLTVDARLTSAAQAHSADMAAHNYFDHNSPDGTTPFQRITAAGYHYSVAAENIAAGQATPAAVMSAWMNSAGHRANILNCSLHQIGVGYATGGSYGSYWTQDFGSP